MNADAKLAERISQLEEWKQTIAKEVLKVIEGVDGLVLVWKWDTAVWQSNGKNVIALSAFKDHVKLNFFEGAKLDDKDGLINSGLDSKMHRGVDYFEQDTVAKQALKGMIQEAIKLAN